MKRFENIRQNIQHNLKGLSCPNAKKKAFLLIQVLKYKNVELGCIHNQIAVSTFYNWLAKVKDHNFDLSCLTNKSTKPKNSPNKTSAENEELVEKMYEKQGKSDRVLAILLEREHGLKIGHSTICRIIKRRGKVGKKYRTAKPNPFKRRYSYREPLEKVQTDTLWTGLETDQGHRVYMAGLVDDCSRTVYAELSDEKTGTATTAALEGFIKKVGKPKVVQTDGGTEFTYRYVSELNYKRKKEARKSAFEQALEFHGIEHWVTKPRTPQHNGKIERFNQTVLNEFSSRVSNNLPMDTYKKLFAGFITWYNQKRPHYSLNYLTPEQKFKQPRSPTAA